MHTRRSLAALALLTLVAGSAFAQNYPERSIKLVVPYAPGGSADIAARLITDEWGKALGGTMFIENRGGAGGGGPALTDTIAGQVDMSFPVLSAAQQHVQAGKLRALGVTGTKRSALMPNVPTIAEAGLPKYAFETWFMVFAPTGTPASVIDKLNAALNKALATTALKDRMVKEGFDPLPSTPTQARSRLEREMPQWAALIKERGITAD